MLNRIHEGAKIAPIEKVKKIQKVKPKLKIQKDKKEKAFQDVLKKIIDKNKT